MFFSVPRSSRVYVHRVGRTARAGRAGRALSLVTPMDVKLLKAAEAAAGVNMEEFVVKDEEVADILTQVKKAFKTVSLKKYFSFGFYKSNNSFLSFQRIFYFDN